MCTARRGTRGLHDRRPAVGVVGCAFHREQRAPGLLESSRFGGPGRRCFGGLAGDSRRGAAGALVVEAGGFERTGHLHGHDLGSTPRCRMRRPVRRVHDCPSHRCPAAPPSAAHRTRALESLSDLEVEPDGTVPVDPHLRRQSLPPMLAVFRLPAGQSSGRLRPVSDSGRRCQQLPDHEIESPSIVPLFRCDRKWTVPAPNIEIRHVDTGCLLPDWLPC
jgi:hypothetical protein